MNLRRLATRRTLPAFLWWWLNGVSATQGSIDSRSARDKAVTFNDGRALCRAASLPRLALVLTLGTGLAGCGDRVLEQQAEALSVARPTTSDERQRGSNAVERIETPPTPFGMGSSPPSSDSEGPECTPILSLLDSMHQVVSTRWLVVEGTVASTPTTIMREREDGGRWGVGQRYHWTSFEFDVHRSSDPALSRTPRIMISHIEQTDSKTPAGAYQLRRRDALDGRARRATVSAGQRRLLILARDTFALTHWQLIAIVPTDGTTLLEGIAGRRSSETVDSLFEAHRVASREREVVR